jgi:hypothetical protein
MLLKQSRKGSLVAVLPLGSCKGLSTLTLALALSKKGERRESKGKDDNPNNIPCTLLAVRVAAKWLRPD